MRARKQKKISKRIRRRLYEVSANSYVQIVVALMVIVFLGGMAVLAFEHNPKDSNTYIVQDWYDGIWWAFVTVFTIGYGDVFPVTAGGKVSAVFVMTAGVATISLLTAVISSAFVQQSIRKGQGLESVKLKDHFVICGWNFNIEDIINTLAGEMDYPSIVLVNSCDPSPIGEIITRHKDCEISFVAGDFSRDAILDKACVRTAQCVIIVADTNELSSNKADEKTVITTLTIKNMNSKIRVFAHVVNRENAQNLKRAKADDVVISDKYSGFLLAMHITNPGVPRVVDELLTHSFGNEIVRLAIPKEYIGKTFWELGTYVKNVEDSMLIGVAIESRSIAMNDLLSDDNSYLDQFIRQKLQESGKKFGEEERVKMQINPPKGLIIEDNHVAIVIGDKF